MRIFGIPIIPILIVVMIVAAVTYGLYCACKGMKRRDPLGKIILGIFILGTYGTFAFWVAYPEWMAILSSGNNTSWGAGGLVLILYEVFGTIAILLVSIGAVYLFKREYLMKNIIIYTAIGLFISTAALFAPFNNHLVLGDRYIIPYVKQHENHFDLTRAKQLTHDPNLQTSDGMPLLPLALYYEKYDYADYLISIGADVGFYDTYGERLSYRHGLVPNGMKQFVARHNIPGFDFTARRLSLEEASKKADAVLTKEITPDDLWETAQAQLFVEKDNIYYVANNGGYVRRLDATEKTLVSVCTQSADAPYTVTFYLRDDGGRYRVGFLSPEDNYTMQFEKVEYPDAYLARGEDGMVYLCSGEKRLILEP